MVLKSDITFTFDRDNLEWQNNMEFNKAVIKAHVDFLGKMFETRGYIYLNDIYEFFHIKWDPRRINQCLIYGEDGNEIRLIHIDENVDGILFTIAFIAN